MHKNHIKVNLETKKKLFFFSKYDDKDEPILYIHIFMNEVSLIILDKYIHKSYFPYH